MDSDEEVRDGNWSIKVYLQGVTYHTHHRDSSPWRRLCGAYVNPCAHGHAPGAGPACGIPYRDRTCQYTNANVCANVNTNAERHANTNAHPHANA